MRFGDIFLAEVIKSIVVLKFKFLTESTNIIRHCIQIGVIFLTIFFL